jgi:MFS family permease
MALFHHKPSLSTNHALKTPAPIITRNLKYIAAASFFWSFSTLMVMALLPVYLSEVLGASKISIGFMEGIALALAFMMKLGAGIGSDYLKNRKALIAWGSFLNILTKGLFALCASAGAIFLVRTLDRMGKGLRSSPTDAFIADEMYREKGATSFGFKQSIYTLGGVTGALVAWGACGLGATYETIFILSMLPASIAFSFVYWGLKPSKVHYEPLNHRGRLHVSDFKHLPKTFFILLLFAFILMLARFSEAFVALYARDMTWPIAHIPFLVVAMDLSNACTAYPAGKLADRLGRKRVMGTAILCLVLANVCFLCFPSFLGIILGVILAGIHGGMMQGAFASLISLCVPPALRGSAYALYYFTAGIALLIGNTHAGFLCDTLGTTGPFIGGLCISGFLLIMFLVFFQNFLYRQEKI